MQPLQYISDYTGKHTAVVIPISEWENIVRKYADLKLLEQESSNEKAVSGQYTMGDFAGILAPERADALLKHVEQSRSEWDRDF
ncbi:hypothetical protein ACQ86N_21915 [Puia sp. P3]|uniref:hypothetical protein n=1 Tax=Puia sp. P3 TaxID=3423952 RepID=UPI003D66A91D